MNYAIKMSAKVEAHFLEFTRLMIKNQGPCNGEIKQSRHNQTS